MPAARLRATCRANTVASTLIDFPSLRRTFSIVCIDLVNDQGKRGESAAIAQCRPLGAVEERLRSLNVGTPEPGQSAQPTGLSGYESFGDPRRPCPHCRCIPAHQRAHSILSALSRRRGAGLSIPYRVGLGDHLVAGPPSAARSRLLNILIVPRRQVRVHHHRADVRVPQPRRHLGDRDTSPNESAGERVPEQVPAAPFPLAGVALEDGHGFLDRLQGFHPPGHSPHA